MASSAFCQKAGGHNCDGPRQGRPPKGLLTTARVVNPPLQDMLTRGPSCLNLPRAFSAESCFGLFTCEITLPCPRDDLEGPWLCFLFGSARFCQLELHALSALLSSLIKRIHVFVSSKSALSRSGLRHFLSGGRKSISVTYFLLDWLLFTSLLFYQFWSVRRAAGTQFSEEVKGIWQSFPNNHMAILNRQRMFH